MLNLDFLVNPHIMNAFSTLFIRTKNQCQLILSMILNFPRDTESALKKTSLESFLGSIL
jgi:hypothetical protein